MFHTALPVCIWQPVCSQCLIWAFSKSKSFVVDNLPFVGRTQSAEWRTYMFRRSFDVHSSHTIPSLKHQHHYHTLTSTSNSSKMLSLKAAATTLAVLLFTTTTSATIFPSCQAAAVGHGQPRGRNERHANGVLECTVHR